MFLMAQASYCGRKGVKGKPFSPQDSNKTESSARAFRDATEEFCCGVVKGTMVSFTLEKSFYRVASSTR